ncbi:MAG: hypothetical protein U0931_31995 [Vulcanimicrobiota bacterium]
MNRRRGLNLLEVVLVSGLFSLLSVLGFLIFRNSSKIFTTTSGRDRASAQLIKAGQWLRRDLESARATPQTLAISTVPGSLGGGADSDALIFLSPKNPLNGQAQTHSDGRPFWMRNILYYGIVPTDYSRLIDQTISGGNVGGYEVNCPVKQLVRVEIDQNTGNDPNNDSTEDQLVTSLSAYLTRPTGVFSSATRKTVAAGLLSFRCQQVGPELRVDLRAVSIDEARRNQGFGASVSYASGRYTIQQTFSVFSH